MKNKKNPELKLLFEERMKKLLEPADYGRYKKILNQPILRSIRCNTLKISPDELKKILENKNWKIYQPWKNYPEVMIVNGKNSEEGLIELEPGELGRALEHILGYYYIQELEYASDNCLKTKTKRKIFRFVCVAWFKDNTSMFRNEKCWNNYC